MLPPCLRNAPTQLELETGWCKISRQLFDELHIALLSEDPPPPAALREALEPWRRYDPGDDAGTVPQRVVKIWLRAYEIAFKTRDTEKISGPPYIVACARLLRQVRRIRISVPFVFVDQRHQKAHVATIEIAMVRSSRFLSLHPSFVHRRHEVEAGSGSFLAGIEAAWEAAGGQTDEGMSVFWWPAAIDGTPLPNVQLDGRSASGAAFRTFWHALEVKSVDPAVYVLCEVSADGQVRRVEDLPKKIAAIREIHRSPESFPPTIIVAKELAESERAILRSAEEWAETKIAETPEEILEVRSCAAHAAMTYLECMAAAMDRSKWWRDGREITLSEILVPPHVWKENLQSGDLDPLETAGGSREHFRQDWRPGGHDAVTVAREVAPSLDHARRQWRVPWEQEFHRIRQDMLRISFTLRLQSDKQGKLRLIPQPEPADAQGSGEFAAAPANSSQLDETYWHKKPLVLIGGPGIGKSCLLRSSAREVALAGYEWAANRAAEIEQLHWPVFADLTVFASAEETAVRSLTTSAIHAAMLPELSPLRRQALDRLFEKRLRRAMLERGKPGEAFDAVYLFFDALDQVPPRCSDRLTQRLRELGELAAHTVITTREAGLATHHLPWEDCPTYQIALLDVDEAEALCKRWLPRRAARRLSRHLDRTPELRLVRASPLLHTLACVAAREHAGEELPENSFKLYRTIIRSMLRGKWRGPAGQVDDTRAESRLAGLEALAWRVFVRFAGDNRFTHGVLVEELQSIWGCGLREATDELQALIQVGVLESSGYLDNNLHYCFTHNTFGEFLAATYAARRANEGGGVARASISAWHQTWWEEPLRSVLVAKNCDPRWAAFFQFLTAGLDAPAGLISIITKSPGSQTCRHQSALGMQCYAMLSAAERKEIEKAVNRDIGIHIMFRYARIASLGGPHDVTEALLAFLSSQEDGPSKIERYLHHCLDCYEECSSFALSVARAAGQLVKFAAVRSTLARVVRRCRAHRFGIDSPDKAFESAEILLTFGIARFFACGMKIMAAVFQDLRTSNTIRTNASKYLFGGYPKCERMANQAAHWAADHARQNPYPLVLAAGADSGVSEGLVHAKVSRALMLVFSHPGCSAYVHLLAGGIAFSRGEDSIQESLAALCRDLLNRFEQTLTLPEDMRKIWWRTDCSMEKMIRLGYHMVDPAIVAARAAWTLVRISTDAAERSAAVVFLRKLAGDEFRQPLAMRVHACQMFLKLPGESVRETGRRLIDDLIWQLMGKRNGSGEKSRDLGANLRSFARPNFPGDGKSNQYERDGALSQTHYDTARMIVEFDEIWARDMLAKVGCADHEFMDLIVDALSERGWRLDSLIARLPWSGFFALPFMHALLRAMTSLPTPFGSAHFDRLKEWLDAHPPGSREYAHRIVEHYRPVKAVGRAN